PVAPSAVPAALTAAPVGVAAAEPAPAAPQPDVAGGPPSALVAAWPFLLLAVGVVGLALTGGRLLRLRRMACTRQSVGMLLRAAGTKVRRQLPALQMPTMTLPKIALPALHWTVWRLRRAAPPTLDLPALPIAPAVPPAEDTPVALAARASAHLGGAVVVEGQEPRRDADLGVLLAAQEIALPEVVIPTAAPGDLDTGWNTEDRALAVAATLAEVWSCERFVSPVLALDTALVSGSAQVVVTIDAVPDEDERLTGLPDRLAALRPAWRSRWKAAQHPTATLTIDVNTAGALPGAGGPIIAPVLHHGWGNKVARYFPLGAWRHLGFYGAAGAGALHTFLTGVLYTQPPSAIALALLDQGQISPLYRGVAHRVETPGDVRATCEALSHSLRRGGAARDDVRPLLLIIVEPDTEALTALTTLLTRLRQQPSAPIHLLIAQERLHAAGRELYAMLPALITSGGQGAASWLPGQQGEWPKRDAARLVGRGMRVEGRAATQTEAEVADLLAPLRRSAAQLPPVLWDAMAPEVLEPARAPEALPLYTPPVAADAVVLPTTASAVLAVADSIPAPHPVSDECPDVRTPDAVLDTTLEGGAQGAHAEEHRESLASGAVIAEEAATPADASLADESDIAASPVLPAGAEDGTSVPVSAAVPDTACAMKAAPPPVVPSPSDVCPDVRTGGEEKVDPTREEDATPAATIAPETPVEGAAAPADNNRVAPAAPLAADAERDSAPPPVDTIPERVDDGGGTTMPGPAASECPDVRTPGNVLGAASREALEAQPDLLPRSTPEVASSSPETMALARGEDDEEDALADVLARMEAADASARTRPTVLPARQGAPAASAHPPEEPDNGWPRGPDSLGRMTMAALVRQLVVDPDILTAKQADQVGVTKKRLQALGQRLGLFPDTQARQIAETLVVWFDRAGVLVAPLKSKEHPLNQPRALERTDPEWICERLNATALPTPDAVRAAFAAPHGGVTP
ncbi:MAG TPA: hypothetical protein VNL77_17540, partial [Roseiflexaceae bacterium]|nr:hypothetical protein [Roseiflexaceae bacterium]